MTSRVPYSVSALFRVLIAAVFAACAALPACTSRDEQPALPRYAQSRVTSANGLTVSVFVSQQELSIADRLEVLIEARRDATADPVPWPEMLESAAAGEPFPPQSSGAEPADWTILEITRRTLKPGHETIELVLEPYLSGNKSVPALTFDIAGQRLTTEPIGVNITSELQRSDSSAAPGDPLAALTDLGPALMPMPPRRSLLESPLIWGLAGALGVVVLAGGSAIIAARSARRRSLTPDEHLERLLLLGRKALETPDSPHVEEVAAKTVGAFRIWLAATRRVPRGASDRELAAWVRASGVPSAPQLAGCLAAYDGSRFAPVGRFEIGQARELVGGVWSFSRELRALAASAAEGGLAS